MKAKYYTPEIEEFHVGFEYEIEDMTPAGNTTEYKKHIITEDDNIKEIYESNDWYGKPRVKCLDKEDIESLEWEFIKIHPGTTSHDFELGNYSLSFDPEFGQYWNLRIFDGEYQDNEFNYFNGFVKNKSELKKLMFQNGILKRK